MIEAGGRRPSRFLSALPFPLRRLSQGHFSRPGGHKIGQNRKGHMSMKNVKIFLLRRWYVIGSAALLAAGDLMGELVAVLPEAKRVQEVLHGQGLV